MKPEKQVFKRGSTTYYYSSLFFPKAVRGDVFKLYSFVRIADDYVDNFPQDYEGFCELRRQWRSIVDDSKIIVPENSSVAIRVSKNMADLVRKHGIETGWVHDFLDAMESDFTHSSPESMAQSLDYVYGSAEVIGLMMSKIMSLPEDAYNAAKMQGRAMQWINFIRDVEEDYELQRRYFPATSLRKFGLEDLTPETAKMRPQKFNAFIRSQIDLYRGWQTEAEAGYRYIPKRYLVPLKTANDMYCWTADQIYKDPAVVFYKKVKPSKWRVLFRIFVNTLRSG